MEEWISSFSDNPVLPEKIVSPIEMFCLVLNFLFWTTACPSIKNISSSKEAINFYVARSIKKFVKFRKKETILNLKQFRKEPKEIRFRIINNIVKKRTNSYYPPRSEKVLNLVNNFQANNLKKCTLGGCIFERKRSFLYVSKEL